MQSEGPLPSPSIAQHRQPADATSTEQAVMQRVLTNRAKQLLFKRCWQLLHDGVTPLEQDLGLLAADEVTNDTAAEIYVRLLQHYRQVGGQQIVIIYACASI